MIRKTRPVRVGQLIIGGRTNEDRAYLPVQTMWKEALTAQSLHAAAGELETLGAMGCDLVRFSAPTIEQAELLGELSAMTNMPLVADIHFDWRIALRCMDFPIAKIRINPGNIGGRWKVAELVAKAASTGTALRIGVNSGSLPRDLADMPDKVEALVATAEREAAVFDELNFFDYIVSMKTSSVDETLAVNRLFASRHDIPLHVGVTEAGPLVTGTVRSSVALYTLLKEGIGDTVRVSLSAAPREEVAAGLEICALASGHRRRAHIISCPRCGRAGFDTHAFTSRWMEKIYAIQKPLAVAVMGCIVNGPGEAKQADLGISGAGDTIAIFSKGRIARTCTAKEADTVFMEELSRLC